MTNKATTEVAAKADFSLLRYAMVWEDADILLKALKIEPRDSCLSIASAGDNALAMLLADPAKVVAVDLNPSQLAALELRVAMYRNLKHGEFLQLMGSRDASAEQRRKLFARLEHDLSTATSNFWRQQALAVDFGIGSAGKFERYFAIFRSRVLPLVHNKKRVHALLQGGKREVREAFYNTRWNTLRWRLLFRIFFSKFVMGRLGRDPSFFRYIAGSLADHLIARTKHALVELNPANNPYLHWILTGAHGEVLPPALREDHFETIRSRLNRIEWHCESLESHLDKSPSARFQRYNMSNLFEYMSASAYEALLERLIASANPGARFVYWNMLTPRSRPDSLRGKLKPMDQEAQNLLQEDRAFFYSRLVIEEVTV